MSDFETSVLKCSLILIFIIYSLKAKVIFIPFDTSCSHETAFEDNDSFVWIRVSMQNLLF